MYVPIPFRYNLMSYIVRWPISEDFDTHIWLLQSFYVHTHICHLGSYAHVISESLQNMVLLRKENFPVHL
jgi:hypothetical protein